MDKLVLLAGYLKIHRLNSANAHVTEANTLLTATEEQAELVMNQIHVHKPAAGQAAAWAQAQGIVVPHAMAKPVMALKPDKHSFDANLGGTALVEATLYLVPLILQLPHLSHCGPASLSHHLHQR